MRGGARKGAGRPRNTLGPAKKLAKVSTIAISEELAKRHIQITDITPLEVMLENMVWARDVGMETLTKCVEAATQMDPHKAVDFFRETLRLRAISQECAQAAAPYIHPRLSAVVHTPEEIKPEVTEANARANDRLAHLKERYLGKIEEAEVVKTQAKQARTEGGSI